MGQLSPTFLPDISGILVSIFIQTCLQKRFKNSIQKSVPRVKIDLEKQRTCPFHYIGFSERVEKINYEVTDFTQMRCSDFRKWNPFPEVLIRFKIARF